MKKILAIVLAIVMLLAFTACGSLKFKYAYITLPNGNVIEVEVDAYIVHSTSIEITAKDGRSYEVSMVNCLLTTDRLYEVGK